MDGSESDRWGAFARAIADRRQALDLTQREVYAAGGPSPTTLVRWESGEGPTTPPRPKALARLDTALHWPTGTAKGLLNGDIGVEEALNLPEDPSGMPDPSSIEASLDPSRLITDLSARLLRYLMATTSINGIDPELAAEGEELTERVSEHYVTLLLERYGGPDRELPDDIGNIVIPALTAPEPQRGSPEHHRWAYRRWLAGVAFPDDDAAEFQKYWDTRTYGRIG